MKCTFSMDFLEVVRGNAGLGFLFSSFHNYARPTLKRSRIAGDLET